MSDLRGYTRFAEQGDPQRVMEVLNGYLARMTDIIVEYGGTINEFIGDAVFAVFGAPLAHRDHAEAAAATALAMQRAMFEINAQHQTRGFPRFEMGIGVNTGEAVGNIGSKQRQVRRRGRRRQPRLPDRRLHGPGTDLHQPVHLRAHPRPGRGGADCPHPV